MRILVTGSRDWTDEVTLANAILQARIDAPVSDTPVRVVIIHGACPTGADRMAAHYAENWGWAVEGYPPLEADIKRLGFPRACFLRNKKMVDLGADVCLAFYKKGAANKGTALTVDLAEKAGIPVVPYESA